MNELNLDSDYFKYILYSYNLSDEDGDEILYNLKEDIAEDKINEFTLIKSLEDYCKLQIHNREIEEKITYLYTLIDSDDYSITKIKKQYKLNTRDIEEIADKVEKDILKNNIAKYVIKRNIEKYSRQKYILRRNQKQLKRIADNLENQFILKKLDKVKNVNITEVRQIITDINIQLNRGKYFKDNIKNIILKEIDIMSNNKKIQAQKKLSELQKTPNTFDNFLEKHNLNHNDKEILIKKTEEQIDNGEIQSSNINLGIIKLAEEMSK